MKDCVYLKFFVVQSHGQRSINATVAEAGLGCSINDAAEAGTA
jgi:hypothetical protein